MKTLIAFPILMENLCLANSGRGSAGLNHSMDYLPIHLNVQATQVFTTRPRISWPNHAVFTDRDLSVWGSTDQCC